MKENHTLANKQENKISQINSLCELLRLGELTKAPKKISGIFFHRTWHIQTSTGDYAVKQLNPDSVADEHSRRAFERTEQIARKFIDKEIGAVASITYQNRALIDINDETYLVRPWVKGNVIDRDAVSLFHAEKIAILIANLHRLNFSFSEMTPEWDLHSNEYFQRLIQSAGVAHLPFEKDLRATLPDIFAWNDNYQRSIKSLNKHVLVSHGDIDQRNVVWQQNFTPILIDWESARLINPTLEILTVSLDWSGINTKLNLEVFERMLHIYLKEGGMLKDNTREAFFGFIGNRLNWMAYNIELCLAKETTTDERQLNTLHVIQLLNTLKYFTAHLDSLIHKTHKIVGDL